MGRQDIAAEVGLTALPARPLELDRNCTDEPAVVIGDNQIDSMQAALLEPRAQCAPALLGLAVTDLHPSTSR